MIEGLTPSPQIRDCFCGYCGNMQKLVTKQEFIIHLDKCEKIKADEYHNKRGNNRAC